jgi:hypothetical protein
MFIRMNDWKIKGSRGIHTEIRIITFVVTELSLLRCIFETHDSWHISIFQRLSHYYIKDRNGLIESCKVDVMQQILFETFNRVQTAILQSFIINGPLNRRRSLDLISSKVTLLMKPD